MSKEKMFDLKNFNIKDLINNKKELFEKTENMVVPYSEFVEKAKSSKLLYASLKGRIEEMEETKKDFEAGRTKMSFVVEGSKKERFGGKINREDDYAIDDIEHLKENLEQYFYKFAPLTVKKDHIDVLLSEFNLSAENDKEKQKVLFDHIIASKVEELKEKKIINIKLGSAKISVTLEPIDQFYELRGSKGTRIDLSK